VCVCVCLSLSPSLYPSLSLSLAFSLFLSLPQVVVVDLNETSCADECSRLLTSAVC
jgi:hypothetical protein